MYSQIPRTDASSDDRLVHQLCPNHFRSGVPKGPVKIPVRMKHLRFQLHCAVTLARPAEWKSQSDSHWGQLFAASSAADENAYESSRFVHLLQPDGILGNYRGQQLLCHW